MTAYSFLNSLLTPTAQAAVAADPSIVSVLLIVILALSGMGIGCWYIGFATEKARKLREQKRRARAENKRQGKNRRIMGLAVLGRE